MAQAGMGSEKIAEIVQLYADGQIDEGEFKAILREAGGLNEPLSGTDRVIGADGEAGITRETAKLREDTAPVRSMTSKANADQIRQKEQGGIDLRTYDPTQHISPRARQEAGLREVVATQPRVQDTIAEGLGGALSATGEFLAGDPHPRAPQRGGAALQGSPLDATDEEQGYDPGSPPAARGKPEGRAAPRQSSRGTSKEAMRAELNRDDRRKAQQGIEPVSPPVITPIENRLPWIQRPRVKEALLTAGLAMMAGRSRNALVNIGQGGLAGMEAYRRSGEREVKQQTAAEKMKMEREKLALERRKTAATEKLNKARSETERAKALMELKKLENFDTKHDEVRFMMMVQQIMATQGLSEKEAIEKATKIFSGAKGKTGDAGLGMTAPETRPSLNSLAAGL